MNREPTRRVVLLGASNLVRSISTVVETARQIWREPVEIMAAIGHGRSYGRESRLLGRKISGIFPCALWKDLQSRPPLPTVALVTDIGNDLGYEVPVHTLVEWVEGCLNRLQVAGARTVVTQLPIASLDGLSEAKFRFFRALYFPRCQLALEDIRAASLALNRQLITLGDKKNISVIPVSGAWYGFDPIHLKRTQWSRAWPAILAEWHERGPAATTPRVSFARWAYLRTLTPLERSVFGYEQRMQQPSGVLRDGTTISLY